MSFIHYPEIEDERFYDDIYKKKEFFKTRTGPEFYAKDIKDVCNPREFVLANHQEFARNFISPETPYNGVLLIHGTGVGKTCAAISITEGLRDYVHKMGKKIYVIASSTIQKNFRKELYDPNREAREKSTHGVPGSYQCAGDTYYDDTIDPKKRRDRINAKINKYYAMYGPGAFANAVDSRFKGKFKTDEEVARHLMNSVFVIDEAHGIAGECKLKSKAKKAKDSVSESKRDETVQEEQEAEFDEYGDEGDLDGDVEMGKTVVGKRSISDRTLLAIFLGQEGSAKKGLIQRCRELGGNFKIILLTATPMKDNKEEIADLLQLLNENDNKRLNRETLFPKDKLINEAYLKQVSRGYVSFVRGNNPISFPRALLPADEENLYEPNPYLSRKSEQLEEKQYQIKFTDKVSYKYNLYRCPMSLYHYIVYLSLTNADTTTGTDRSQQDIAGRQISNFVFPASNIDDILEGDDIEFPEGSNIRSLFGGQGLSKSFVKKEHSVTGDGKKKKHGAFEYNESVLNKYGLFLMMNNPMKPKYNLSMFSGKMEKVIQNVNNSPGIAFIYSEFVDAGALTLALAFEANGYVMYHPNIKYNETTGLPTNLANHPASRLLSYTNKKNKSAYGKYLTKHFRCVCGRLYEEHIDGKCPAGSSTKKFKQAAYLIYTGKYKREDAIEVVTHPTNRYGHVAKIIIGTKTMNEGVDLKWVRQVHILDPWHNNTRIFQAIGRGIRRCSHVDLKPHERNVTIYKYASSVPSFNAKQKLLVNGTAREVDYIMNDAASKAYAIANADDLIDVEYESESDSELVTLNIAYSDLITETVDELVYNRVVRKDVEIKQIERVLKKNAVDCELNKHMNYHGENDKDYTRDCDYQECKYTCNLSDDYETIDLAIRRIDDNYWIRSNKYLSDSEWHKLISITIPQFETIRDSAEAEWEFDYTSSSTKQEIADNIFEKLQHVVGTPSRRENEDGNLVEELYYEKPIVDVDLSTYNVHFAKPQIIRAKMSIIELFLHNVALSENIIVRIIKQKNPMIDVEFIRSALDQLVGKPPYILPAKIKDRYGRICNLIYVGKFYVLQPIILKDTKIPMHYRKVPLKIKKDNIDLQPLVVKTKIVKEANYVLNEKELTAVIAKFKDMLKDLPKSGMDDETYYRYLSQLVGIRMMLDRMILLDQEWIVKKVIKDLYSGAATDDSSKLLFDILLEYYKQQALIIQKNHELYCLMNGSYHFNKRSNIWIEHVIGDDLGSYINSQKLTPVNVMLTEKNYNGIYGYIGLSGNRKTPNIIDDEYISYQTITDSVKKINNEIKNKYVAEKLRFKILNNVDKKVEYTQTKAKSTRSLAKGIVCSSQNQGKILALVGILKDLLEQIKKDKVKKDGHVIDSNKIIRVIGLDKHGLCDQMEKLLRLIDYITFDNKRWFLSPFELQYYRS